MRAWLPRELGFVRRGVGRRILLLFVVCALLPVTVLAAIAFVQVTDQLRTQSSLRLRQASKATAMSIVERANLLEKHLEISARRIATTGPARGDDQAGAAFQGNGIRNVAVVTEAGDLERSLGRVEPVPGLGEPARQRLRDGKTVLSTHPTPDGPAGVFMWMPLAAHGSPGRVLVAEIDTPWLWGAGDKNTLPPATELCVLDDEGAVLACTLERPVALPAHIAARIPIDVSENFEWTLGKRQYLASYWSMPMQFRFGVPRWTVVVSEARADVMAPMAQFAWTFPSIALLSLWVVLLLSVRQIRGTLGPLEQLQVATRRLAQRDFSTRVAVSSGDEFEELAGSFNAMADRLHKQFGTLTALAALDSAILSSLDAREIASTVLAQANSVVPCDEVRVTLVEAGSAGMASTYVGATTEAGEPQVLATELTPHDLDALRQHGAYLYTDVTTSPPPPYLQRAARGDIKHFLVWPIAARDRLAAIVSLGYVEPPCHTEDDRAAMRQVADQLAVALTNAEEVAERERAERRLVDSNERLEQALADLKATQQQVLQQERLHALGQMASGIAHDFNNTLTPILGYTELLLDAPNLGDDKARRYLKLMNTAAKDAGSIVQRLREFYRVREAEPVREIALNALVEEAVVLTQPRWRDQALAHGAAIQMETELLDVPPVAAVEAEIRELLTNLIFNAVDAMPEGGVITIRTLPEADRVALEVSDSGTGMSEEVRRRCLEPFFSTKGQRGTGLGLAMVYGIVKRHGGSLDIESDLGFGTTFIIRLPVHMQSSAGPSVLEAAPLGRVLRVLLADDDREARDVIRAYLSSDGHVVRTAANGSEAWGEFQRGRFDLVITDRVMPGMNGERLAAAIKQTARTVPVILLSGFADLHGEGAVSLQGVDVVLNKPLTLAALRDAVARCMRDREPSPPTLLAR